MFQPKVLPIYGIRDIVSTELYPYVEEFQNSDQDYPLPLEIEIKGINQLSKKVEEVVPIDEEKPLIELRKEMKEKISVDEMSKWIMEISNSLTSDEKVRIALIYFLTYTISDVDYINL